MDEFVNRFANWPFLNEPLYRWFLFFLAIGFMSWGWNGVISLMK